VSEWTGETVSDWTGETMVHKKRRSAVVIITLEKLDGF